MNGSITITTAGGLASSSLAATEAAQIARQLRANRTKRHLQRGGVIYAGDARHMVQEKVEDSLEKAREALAKEEAKEVRKQSPTAKDLLKLTKAF